MGEDRRCTVRTCQQNGLQNRIANPQEKPAALGVELNLRLKAVKPLSRGRCPFASTRVPRIPRCVRLSCSSCNGRHLPRSSYSRNFS
jgi:hypothetical protein